MESYIEIQKAIAPDLLQVIQRRYALMRSVAHLAPIGRRMLADSLQMGERVVRSELEELKKLGLIESDSAGVGLTARGHELLRFMTPYVKELLGLPGLESQVALKLGIPRVIIVPGNSDSDNLVSRELGRAAARILVQQIRDGDIIAITGGSTMSHVADSITAEKYRVTVVPGRGALGERVEIQANTIAAKLAQALGGSYRLLHAPDNLSRQALDELVRDPGIAEVLALVRRTTILIHGIGQALDMAARRDVPSDQLGALINLDAVAETFGFYFNDRGEIVWQANSIGLRLGDLESIKTVIAVAGGAAKARAIRAVAAHRSQDILVTDQGAAEAILQLP
jgi:central glycolytic genes regulator